MSRDWELLKGGVLSAGGAHAFYMVSGFFAGIPMETVAVAMAAVLVTIVIGQRMDHPRRFEVERPRAGGRNRQC